MGETAKDTAIHSATELKDRLGDLRCKIVDLGKRGNSVEKKNVVRQSG